MANLTGRYCPTLTSRNAASKNAQIRLGPVAVGVSSDDSLRVMMRKRHAFAALIASVSVQLLSIMLWNNVPIAAAFAAPAVVATAVSLGWFALRESEDPMRWATVACGFLYSGLHFVADGCQATTRTGSGLFFMILPTLTTHLAAGGSAAGCGAAAIAHALLFVIYAAVDGTRDTPCFGAIAAPPVTQSPVATLLMAILPGAVVVAFLLLAQADVAVERADWDATVELASVLLFDVPEGETEAAHAAALKAVSGRTTSSALSVVDEALLLFTSIAAIKQVAPAVVISEGPVVVEPPRKEPAPVPTPSPVAVATPNAPTTLHVVNALNRSTKKRSASASSEDARSQSPAARGAGPRRRSERRGSMRIMPVQSVVLESCYILLVSMPRLSTYAQQTQQAEMMRLLLNEFYTCVEQNATLFEGSVVNACFSDVYVKFGNARLAAAAAHAIQHRLKQDAQHHRDIRFLEVQPTATVCVLLPASTCCGDAMGNGSLGTCDVSGLFDGLKYRASTSPGLPLVLMPTSMCGAVESDFELRDSSIPGISQIVEPRALTEFGFAQVAVAADGAARAYELPEVDDVLRPPMRPGSPEYARLNTAGAPATRGGSRRPKSAKQKEMEASPELLALWRKYDIDNSGALDRAEVGDLMDELGLNMTEDDLGAFFDEVDSDHSGTVSVQEFVRSFNNPNVGGLNAILEVRKAAHALKLKTGASSVHAFYTAWNKYDPTNSGVLQAAELHNVLKDIGVTCSAQQCEWIVEKLDRDGNGKVDYEEMAALFGDDEASLRVNATKARMLLVSRVLGKSKQDATNNVNPPPPGAVFSTDDQLRREKLVRIRDAWDKYMSWPLFMYVSYNMGIEMYRVCRGHDTPTGNIAFDMVFDILFLAWFVLKLLYLPREVKGQLYYKREDITHHYVHSLEFVVDVLTVLPLDFFYFGLVNNAARGIYGYYRVNKILSLYHLDGLFDRVSKAMTPSIQRVTNALMWYIVLSHLFACLFIGTARIIGEDYFTGLIGTSTLLTREETTYLQAVLWALQILAGQIRGDPIPDHILLTGLFLLAVLAGIPTFAGVLGTIGNAIQAESSESRFLQTIDSLRGYFSYTKLPAEIEAECIAYYRHLFFTTGSLDIQANPLSDLPAELAVQITVGTGSEMLKKVPIFKPVCDNVEFVHELTTMLRPRVIEPGQRVMRKGERGDNMYFITYGDFHIVNDDGVTLFTLRKGNFFGEIALLHNVKRTATIVCDKDRYANVMILSKRDFDQVAQTFPDCLSEIYKSAETRLKAILEAEAEEQRKAKEARRAERDAAQSPQAPAKTPPKSQSAQPSTPTPDGATPAPTGTMAAPPAPASTAAVVTPPPATK